MIVRIARTGAAAALAAVVLALAGCTVNPATGRQSFTLFMPPEEEIRLGSQLHPKVSDEMGGPISDRALAAYVDRIGQALAQYAERPELRYTFTVLDSDIVNAFAVPGGYVYVTRGLVALAGTEAELAGVLAHEIGHVTARHAAERYSQSVAAQLLLGVGAAALGDALLTDVMQTGAAIYLQGFSREQEYESDLLGVRYLIRAGYDPRAMSSFLAKLQAHSQLDATLAGRPEAADRFNIMSTHPRTADRVERALAAANAQAPAGPRLVGEAAYMEAIDGLSVDGDARNGFVKRRLFVHPRERFEFQVPPGFRLLPHGENVILAAGPEGAFIQLDWVEVRQRMAMIDYLRLEWAPGHRLAAVEPLAVSGLDAATGALQLATRSGAVDVRLVAIRSAPARVHRYAFVTPPRLTAPLSLDLRRTTHSFRVLSVAEAARATPFRLRVFRARSGDTAEGLAAQMPYDDYRVERFRVLNGLAPGQPLRLGQWVKLVGD